MKQDKITNFIRLKKKVFIFVRIILLLMIVFGTCACSLYTDIYSNLYYDNYETISKYVKQHNQALEKLAKKEIEGKPVKNPKYITMISVHGPDEMHVKNDNTIVEFHMGGKGLAPSSIYYGFYYSKKNVPASFQNGSATLIQYDDGCWKWEDENENYGKTIKIEDNWFYFEAHF